MRLPALAFETIAVLTVLTGSVQVPYARVPEPPTDPGSAVLQVKVWQSLVGPSTHAEIPEVTILGGGRVVVPAGQDGALQRATEYTLTADEYRYLYRSAHRAGLARNQQLSAPIEATDGSMLVMTLRSGERTYTTRAINLWSAEAGIRGRIFRFRRTLGALTAGRTGTPYRPTGYAALVTGGFGTTEGQPAARPWPGVEDLTDGVRTYVGVCTPLTSVPPEVSRTAQWVSGGHTLWVTLRPLLPHERHCADLDKDIP